MGGFEVGVAFDVDHESAEGAGELGFGGAGFGGAFGAHGLCAGFGDGFECFALVAHVAFDGFDEVGDEVVAALELDINLRPGVIHVIAEVDEAVVDGDEPEDEDGEDGEKNENGGHVIFPFLPRGGGVSVDEFECMRCWWSLQVIGAARGARGATGRARGDA